MAKKIKFALEMADGVQVRTIEELRDNFDQGKAMEYFVNGKLLEWLEDRYYDDEAEAISDIEENAPDAVKKICEALGVEYEYDGTDMDDVIDAAAKTAKLKKVTNDETILKNAAYTAFDQEDLADLLDTGTKTIYLYGDVFSVPVKRIRNVKFVGILDSEPKIKLSSGCTKEMLGEKKIEFEGVLLPKEYRDEVAPAKPVEKAASSTSGTSDMQFKVIKKTVYSGMKNITVGPSRKNLVEDFDIEKKFFSVDENEVSEMKDGIDEAVYYMCSDNYSRDDIILLILTDDYSAGFSFTRDSVIICSDMVVNAFPGLEMVNKAIIKYSDIKRVYGDYSEIIINNMVFEMNRLKFGTTRGMDFVKLLLNVCGSLNIRVVQNDDGKWG